MNLGVDLGNYSVKTSERLNFKSLVMRDNGLGDSMNTIKINNEEFILGQGEYDNEYRKFNKRNLEKLLFGSIAMSTNKNEVRVVCGLPISQFQADREKMKEKILSYGSKEVFYKSVTRKINIVDAMVLPEGIGAIDSREFDGVIMDLGGRTTDIFRVCITRGQVKIQNGFSEPVGTLNLYSDFIKSINSNFGLNLKSNEAERIIKNGLKINGKSVDISKYLGTFKDYVEMIIDKLKVEFPIATLDIKAVGGGAVMLGQNIKNKIKHVELLEPNESIFINANYFKKQANKKWGDK